MLAPNRALFHQRLSNYYLTVIAAAKGRKLPCAKFFPFLVVRFGLEKKSSSFFKSSKDSFDNWVGRWSRKREVLKLNIEAAFILLMSIVIPRQRSLNFHELFVKKKKNAWFERVGQVISWICKLRSSIDQSSCVHAKFKVRNHRFRSD